MRDASASLILYMHEQLPEQVRVFLLQHGLFRPEALVVVAVSGGPDSLALLHLLRSLQLAGGPRVHVAHLDHGARGAQSAAEAQMVAELAATWGLPASIAYRDVPTLARTRREGLLAAARYARYNWLATLALHLAADAVAVAHQADDQAETILLHLVRGTGLAGLRGMLPVVAWPAWVPDPSEVGLDAYAGPRPGLIRPLLNIPRKVIEAYCAAHGLQPNDDPSNHYERFARTRMRRMLSLLAQEHPQVVASLTRSAQLIADDYAFIQSQLDAHWPHLVTAYSDQLNVHRAKWEQLHPSLQRYALRRAATLLGLPTPSMAQIEQVRQAEHRSGQRFALGPGVWLAITAEALIIGRATKLPQHPGPQMPVPRIPLTIPGQVELGGGWSVVVQTLPPTLDHPDRTHNPNWLALDRDRLDGPLELRQRQPGDRFRPAGGRGSRKLQDFFVDRKLPRNLRDAWPILATPTTIVWVVGLRADARFVANSPTQGTIWVGLCYAPTEDTT